MGAVNRLRNLPLTKSPFTQVSAFRIEPFSAYKTPWPLGVTADCNLISFSRLYRSAIYHRHSTNTGQYAIRMAGQFGVGGNIPFA